ncbi:hypothetical protein SAY86_026520 [Trapa natans]|uniref:Uncharacterized protein n=1 Tax=Trapa natans TaxID=22666 RepID=A0AAN7KLR8_TRANT|nr:hypothetical protein SAY86_026520 [Trapa natans]
MDNHLGELSYSNVDLYFDTHAPLYDPKLSTDHTSEFKLDEPAPWFDSLAKHILFTEPDALADVPAISLDELDGDLVLPAELDEGSVNPSMSSGASLSVIVGGESPSSSDDRNSSDPVLRYISQMLLEENIEEKEWISPDYFALLNTEKSLYDVLGEQYPKFPEQVLKIDVSQFMESPCGNLFGSNSEMNTAGTPTTNTYSSNSIDPYRLHDPGEYNQSITPAVYPLEQVPQSNPNYRSEIYANPLSNSTRDANLSVDSSSSILLENIFSNDDSIMQFQRGLEEASRFLPASRQFDIEKISSASEAKRGPSQVVACDNKGGEEEDLSVPRGRKNHYREGPDLEAVRSTKQSASYEESEEAELSDMLDKVLLCTDRNGAIGSSRDCQPTNGRRDMQTDAPVQKPNTGSGRGRRRRGNRDSERSVDLRSLLILCAQAISMNNLTNAYELLRQIRENSSPSGDGSQRLAHYFANGLEARIAGKSSSGTQNYFASVAGKRRSVADALKAYRLHLSSCPFKQLSIFYLNWMILKVAQNASVLHIIDFGINFGFQWPILIQKLGEQPGGSPKLRITGIELPQPGFRPAERIEETGRRLARYCERFSVPFEFNALPSRNWETIKREDLKIRPGEVIAVNCLMRFKSLLDETVEEDSPRDALLGLIWSIKPDVFVHAISNGSYNSPFFLTRFKEALFHLSCIYDMFDATITGEQRDSHARTVLEGDFYGSGVMNVIACEGHERVERPETYKQWQARHVRTGFKQLPLDQEIMEKFRHKLESWYHKDFVLDEDGGWMLLGWKGRIMYATTCWVLI